MHFLQTYQFIAYQLGFTTSPNLFSPEVLENASPTGIVIRRLIVIVIMVSTSVAAAIFIVTNLNENWLEASNSAYIFGCYTLMILFHSVFTLNRLAIASVTQHAQETATRRSQLSAELQSIYEKAEMEDTQISRFIQRSIIFMMFLCIYSLLVLPIYQMFRGNFNTTEWSIVFEIYFPFERTSITKFYIFLLFECLSCTVCLSLICAMLVYCIGIFAFLHGCTLDLNASFLEINRYVERHIHDGTSKQYAAKAIKKQLTETIKFYTEVKDIAEQITTFLSVPMFDQAFATIATISVSMYQVEVGFGNISYEIMVELDVMTHQVTILIFFCVYAENFSTDFEAVVIDAYKVLWYKFPLTQQKQFLLFITQSQHPIKFTGLHIVQINRATLFSVIKLGVSYYLMVRRL